jgi:predicted RNA binding protein YcfA (HicA-like mRNA interferase family)
MPKLPVISGKEAVKAFTQVGYELDHQTGSHMISGLTVEEFINLL